MPDSRVSKGAQRRSPLQPSPSFPLPLRQEREASRARCARFLSPARCPMRSPLVWLLAACMVSAVAVVELRHESRVLYAQVQKLQVERDALNVEWGQLLLEEGAWSQHRRIEATARTQLGMELPTTAQIRALTLPAS